MEIFQDVESSFRRADSGKNMSLSGFPSSENV